MKVYDFTVPQLAYYEEFCNFSPQESALFDLRKKGVPLEQCAESMHCEMTTVKQVEQTGQSENYTNDQQHKDE